MNTFLMPFLAAYEAEVLTFDQLEEATSWCNHDIVSLALTHQDTVRDLLLMEDVEDENAKVFATTTNLLEAWSKGFVYLAGDY